MKITKDFDRYSLQSIKFSFSLVQRVKALLEVFSLEDTEGERLAELCFEIAILIDQGDCQVKGLSPVLGFILSDAEVVMPQSSSFLHDYIYGLVKIILKHPLYSAIKNRALTDGEAKEVLEIVFTY